MSSVIKVNPFRCRMWEMHDRLDTHITEESCKAEIESFLKYGQLVPVLGRYIRGDSNHDIVLVYGARRLFVARHLNQPLSVEVRELTDREAIIAADLENRQRTDVSPYERGLSYARWLEAGHFKSQDDIARALKISAAQVSRLLKLASLPKEVVAAFAHTADIHERWGRTLMKVMSNPHAARLTLGKAAAIRKLPQRPPRQEVYRELLTAAVGERRAALASKAEVVKDHGGTRLFRVKRQSNSVVILLPLATVCASRLEHIRREVTRILQEEKHLLGEPIAVPRHPFAKRDADVTACIRGEAT